MSKRNYQRPTPLVKPVVTSRAQKLVDLGQQTFHGKLSQKSQDENVNPPESPCPGEVTEDDYNSFLRVLAQEKPVYSTPRQALVEITPTKNAVAPKLDEGITSPPNKIAKDRDVSSQPVARRTLFDTEKDCNVTVKVSNSASLSLLTAYGSEDSCSCEGDDSFPDTDLNNNGNNFFNLLPTAGEKVTTEDPNILIRSELSIEDTLSFSSGIGTGSSSSHDSSDLSGIIVSEEISTECSEVVLAAVTHGDGTGSTSRPSDNSSDLSGIIVSEEISTECSEVVLAAVIHGDGTGSTSRPSDNSSDLSGIIVSEEISTECSEVVLAAVTHGDGTGSTSRPSDNSSDLSGIIVSEEISTECSEVVLGAVTHGDGTGSTLRPSDNSSDLSALITFTEEISTDCAAEVLAAVNPSHGDALVIPLEPTVAETNEESVQNPTQRDEPVDENNTHDAAFPKPRASKPDTWKKNKVKLLCDSGQAHTSIRGKERAARELGKGCDDKCKRQCHHNFSEDERKGIFTHFWAIQDHTMQWYFISKCVRPQDVKKRTVITPHAQDPRRKQTNVYFLNRDGKDTQVCQKFFLATLAVGERWVRTALQKQKNFKGAIPKDGRGKSSKPSVVKTLIREDVMTHIKKFPTVEGHYTRKNSKARYLPENLNRRKMHSLYVLEKGTPSPQVKIATLRQYRDVFRKEFKIKFFRPRKDQCPRCLSWKNKTPQEKTNEEAKNKYEKHLSDKEISSKMKDEDIEKIKSNPQLQETQCLLTVDLEKVFLCPKGENGDFFYKSKLSCYNLSIFVSGEQKGYCYVWDQTEARRGSAEICSCLWDFILKKVAEGVKVFIIYSNNCSAQNKNQNLFSMYIMACIRFGITIIHRYLEVGHTHMEVDSIHAAIETSCKNVDIFVPSEWYNQIRIAKKQLPRYQVIERKQDMIFKFEAAATHQKWSQLGTSQFKEVHFTHEKPGVVSFKTQYSQNLTSVCVLKKTPGRPVNWKTFQLERKYITKIPMKPHELKDLQELCRSGAIPTKYHEFYLKYLPSAVRNAQEPPPIESFPEVEESDDESSAEESESDGGEEDEEDTDNVEEESGDSVFLP